MECPVSEKYTPKCPYLGVITNPHKLASKAVILFSTCMSFLLSCNEKRGQFLQTFVLSFSKSKAATLMQLYVFTVDCRMNISDIRSFQKERLEDLHDKVQGKHLLTVLKT